MSNKPTQPQPHPKIHTETKDERTGATQEMRDQTSEPKGAPTSDRHEMERTALKDHRKP